jgi:hypothetical protein
MIQYIEKLVKYLPSYFSDFVHLLGNPRHFLKVRMDKEDPKPESENGIIFLFVSFVITLLVYAFAEDNPLDLQIVASGDESLITKLAGKAVYYLIGLAFAILILKLAFKIVGGHAPFVKSFVAFCYILGMLIVFDTVINFAESAIVNLDPFVAKSNVILKKETKKMAEELWNPIEKAATPGDTVNIAELKPTMDKVSDGQQLMELIAKRPIVRATQIGGGIAYLLGFIWLIIAWQCYKEPAGIGSVQNYMALGISIIGLGIFSVLWTVLPFGIEAKKRFQDKYANDSTVTMKDMLGTRQQANDSPGNGSGIEEHNTTASAIPEKLQTEKDNEAILTGTINGMPVTYTVTEQAGNQFAGFFTMDETPAQQYVFAAEVDQRGNMVFTILTNNAVTGWGQLTGNGSNCYNGLLASGDGNEMQISICDK